MGERSLGEVRGELAQLSLSVVLKIDQLADEFESELQTLDTSIVIDITDTSFPYHLLHNLVRY